MKDEGIMYVAHHDIAILVPLNGVHVTRRGFCTCQDDVITFNVKSGRWIFSNTWGQASVENFVLKAESDICLVFI